MSNEKLQEEIRSAKAEIATWSDFKKSSVQLEGTDKYFEQSDRCVEIQNQKNSEELALLK